MRFPQAYLACAIACTLSACASPHFVHDPQIGYFNRNQLPSLLKSLRCELATYVAANNQRHIINTALFPTKPVQANREFPFFDLDPNKFGGASLELKIQDSLGTGSGTAFDWKRIALDTMHSHFWHIGPTLKEQNSYDVVVGFLLPQDIYGLDTSDRASADHEIDELLTNPKQPYLCYKNIPRRDPLVINPNLYNAVFTMQDLDAIALGDKGTPQFDRIWVNGTTPLAAWLEQIGTTMSSTSFAQSHQQDNEHILAGQMTYKFVIQTTASLDVKGSATTTLWTAIAGEISGGFEHTGTLTIVLNGTNATVTSGVNSGNTTRAFSVPKKKNEVTVIRYCPMPFIRAKPRFGYQTGDFCYWPPQPPKRTAKKTKKKIPPVPPGAEQFLGVKPKKEAPPRPSRAPKRPYTRPFLDKNLPSGSIVYPAPLSPLGVPPNQ